MVSATSYGSRFDAAVRAGAIARLEPVTNHGANFRKLIAGRVDAVICSRLVGLYYLGLLGGVDAVEISGPVVERRTAISCSPSRRISRRWPGSSIQTLERMEEDGTITSPD